MRNSSHRSLRVLAIAGALVLAATALAAPALAKEGLAAELDAPVAGGTPGGTKLLIGMTVTVLDEGTRHLVDGSPIYIRLVGPDGAVTRAMAQQGAPGHYTARIEVPASGVAGKLARRHAAGDPAVLAAIPGPPGPTFPHNLRRR